MKSALFFVFFIGLIAASTAAEKRFFSTITNGINGFLDLFRDNTANDPTPPPIVITSTFAPYVFEEPSTMAPTTSKPPVYTKPPTGGYKPTKAPTLPTTTGSLPYDIEDVCIVKKCYDQPGFRSEVCGTNKRTYRNLKILKCVKIQCNPKTDFLKWGSCEAVTTTTTPEPEESIFIQNPVKDEPAKEEGTVVDYECWKKCPRLAAYSPVCGSDNLDYTNESFLSCTNQCGKHVTLQRNGKC